VQIYLDDVDAAVAEVEWAKEVGLSGVLLPPDHHLRLQNLYDTDLDRLWAVCADLGLPVHRHATAVASDEVGAASLAGARACGVYESYYFGRRALFQMILSGVLERHPTLKFVLTEVGGSAWVVHELSGLDRFVQGAQVDGTINALFAADAVASLSKLPSEYFREQCFISTLVARSEVRKRSEIGVDQILWGADFPHHEGTVPYAIETLRATMYDVPEDEVRRMTSLNAARVYDVDLDRLQPLADELGPTVEWIATPLDADEIPDDPEFRLVSGIRA
jgi:predicted TIM-barrel fold metal-dependent hydrolase